MRPTPDQIIDAMRTEGNLGWWLTTHEIANLAGCTMQWASAVLSRHPDVMHGCTLNAGPVRETTWALREWHPDLISA